MPDRELFADGLIRGQCLLHAAWQDGPPWQARASARNVPLYRKHKAQGKASKLGLPASRRIVYPPGRYLPARMSVNSRQGESSMCRTTRRSRLGLLLFAASALFVAEANLTAQPGGASPSPGWVEPHDSADLYNSLRDVINYGAELFNKQADHAGCYRVYQGALISVRPYMA